MPGSDREETLRQSEARFRAIVEYAPEAIVVFDQGKHSLAVANAAAERLSGLPRKELLERGLIGLSPTIQADGRPSEPRLRAYLAEAARGGKPVFEWVIRNANGEDVPCEVRLVQVPQDDQFVIRGSIVDISARKRLQDELAEAQRLEAIGRLAGGVAHDFNNMMSVVLSTAEILLGRLPPEDAMRADLADIVGAAKRAALVARHLLAFGRRQHLEPVLVDLSAQIETMGGVIARLLGESIELRLELEHPLGVVRADRAQIEQVVLNLVINARDAMPDGGRLTLRTSNVTFVDDCQRARRNVPHGRYVMLAVSDTGSGMSEAVRAHVFEPYFTTKELGGSTGMGLATAHGIVEQSGGYIRVRSAPGTGTTFSVYLSPVDDEKPDETRPA